jgi:phosphocarrier protein
VYWVSAPVLSAASDREKSRSCARVANLASQFDAAARICSGRQEADATSVLELMTLAASEGTRLFLEVEGPQAEALFDALVREFEQHAHTDGE